MVVMKIIQSFPVGELGMLEILAKIPIIRYYFSDIFVLKIFKIVVGSSYSSYRFSCFSSFVNVII